LKQLINALNSMQTTRKLAILGMIAVLLVIGLKGNKPAESIPTDEEKRIERILNEIEGIKRASVMISYDKEAVKLGAVVAAEGKDDIRTMLEIQRAVKTLTGLELDSIEVIISGR